MAQVIKIEAQGGTPTYNILAGVLRMNKDTWVIDPEGGESFVLYGADTDANLIAAAQTLDELAELVDLWWSDNKRTASVWWHVKADAETAKRALISQLLITPVSRNPYTPILGNEGITYDVAVERSPVWEDESLTTFVNAQTLSAMGGSYTIAAQKGSLPARIALTRFAAGANSGAVNLLKVWAGIKPTRFGVSSFVPKWELDLGTQILADTTSQADTPATGGTALRCTFGNGEQMLERWKIKVDDVTATTDYNHFVGRYLVLCRARADAAGVFGIQMRTGYSSLTSFMPKETTWFTNQTSYQFYALGEIEIPPHAFRSQISAQDVRNFEIRLAAERVSGTANLWLDCLVLIPAEHSISSDYNQINYANGSHTDFAVFEDDENIAVGYASGTIPINNLAFSFDDWKLPIEGGLLVVAADRVGTSDKDDTLIMTLNGYLRHRMHREA